MQKIPNPNLSRQLLRISIQEIPHSMKSFSNYTGVRKRSDVLWTQSTLYPMWKAKTICYISPEKCGLKWATKCIRRNIFEMKQRIWLLSFPLVTTHSFRLVNSHHPLLAGGNCINNWREENLEGVSFCLILLMRLLDSATVLGTASMW